MAVMARERRIKVYEGYAENLPFEDESFDFILMITLLCFLPDPFQALYEATRGFKSQGQVPPGPPGPAMAERAGQFRTTRTATAIRYCQLSPEPCAVVTSENGIIRWYKKSDSFEFHVKVRENLSSDSYAFDFFDGVDLPTSPQKVPATAWLAGNINEEAEIFEHSLALPRYNVVLSMLWIYEDIRVKRSGYYEDEPKFDLTNPFTPDGKRWLW